MAIFPYFVGTIFFYADNPDASAAAAAQRILQSVKGIPSNPERRVKQAVFLAQRLLETERARDALQVDLIKLREEVKHAKKSAEIAQENLTRAAQPASYLVSKLRDEEGHKNAYLAKCNSFEAELVRTQKECTDSRRECKALKERLQVLLQSRGELETVKEMIAQMGAHLAAEARDEDSSDESDSDSESENSEGESRQDTKASSRSRGSYGGSAEEKRQSLSPASSRHSSHSGKLHLHNIVINLEYVGGYNDPPKRVRNAAGVFYFLFISSLLNNTQQLAILRHHPRSFSTTCKPRPWRWAYHPKNWN